MKRCAFAFLTLHPYLSAVSLDNLTGDVEANAQPRIGFFFGVSDLVEPLKNLVLTLFGNPNPKILDAHEGLFWSFATRTSTVSAWGEYLIALFRRLISTCPMRSRSPDTSAWVCPSSSR